MAWARDGAWAKDRLNPMLLFIYAVVGGLLVGMIAANLWPVLLVVARLSAPTASLVEVAFLAVYVWWFSGAAPGPWRAQRLDFGRSGPITGAQWRWGIVAALAFAASVHAAIVVLFRLVPYPAQAFHAGYDFSFIPGIRLQLLACVVSALSAGVCEEMGFRGYMQRPLENRFGPLLAITVSAVLFTLLHLNKSWALLAMTPIVFGAGLLLGALARASGTLVFSMLGHWIMDIGLFAYWWTQVIGTFRQRPIAETGVDTAFWLELGALVAVLALAIVSIRRLAGLRKRSTA
ncbi:MAG TPA: type II CAAX endopeptidase family protein [Caulobacteraceae bacterium]|nr:type II CAAX endopeptidase family protein [Caulobacteraceae bacterium]